MRLIYNTHDFVITTGFSINRWYVGVAYETLNDLGRAFVFRLGPFYLQFMHRIND